MSNTSTTPKAGRYAPSGKVGSTAFLWLLVDTLLVPLCAALYALVIWYLPIAFFNPLFTFLSGMLVAAVHNRLVIKRGKVRDVSFATYSAYFAVAVFMYTQWVVWISLADGRLGLIDGSSHFLTHPLELLKSIGTIYQTGTWRGPIDSGWLLAVVWVVEFLIIYFSVVPSAKEKACMPFSEAANEWFESKELPKMKFIEDSEAVLAELESGNFSPLRQLTPEKQDTASHSLLTLHSSSKEEYYLTIVNYKATSKSESPSGFTRLRFCKYLGIDRDTGRQLQSALSGKSIALNDNDFKLPLYRKLKFSEKDIRQGEAMYKTLRAGNALYRLNRPYTVWHPRIGAKSVIELYGSMPPAVKVAVINVVQDESADDRAYLAENLFNSINGIPSEEPQEFYELTVAWLERESNPVIRAKLVVTLLMYTSVNEDAKAHLTNLVLADEGIARKVVEGLTRVRFLDAGYRSELALLLGVTEESEQVEQPIRYKCRPGYGSSELLIEILDANDEFFLQAFLNVISDLNPRSESEPTLEDMHRMLLADEVTWQGTSDAGDFSFSQDNYGFAFIHAENNATVIPAIDEILKGSPRFSRLEVNFDDYKKTT